MAQPDLTVNIGSLQLRNPVLAASGTFGYGSEYGRFVDLPEFGGIVTKTLTPEPWPGNPPLGRRDSRRYAQFHRTAERGVEAFVREKMPYLRKMDTALIVNVGGGPVEEFVHVTERLADCDGIDALEINMSCPNVSGGHGLQYRSPSRGRTCYRAARSHESSAHRQADPERYGYHANRPERGGSRR